jgi:hypothetical protein
MPEQGEGQPQTRDGFNLSQHSLRSFALHIASAISPRGASPEVIDTSPLLAAIRAKNKLWHEYWRPSNWAFLYGDRTAQPSSRDHLNPQVRWFPAELEKYHGLIRAKEREIWQQAAQMERRIP